MAAAQALLAALGEGRERHGALSARFMALSAAMPEAPGAYVGRSRRSREKKLHRIGSRLADFPNAPQDLALITPGPTTA
ncbi:hypothetical protein R6254_11345 [Polaromonas sp. SM01]|nr:hypothetical protein [Polaromonas sp. SM01]